jgi:hypothetical protein
VSPLTSPEWSFTGNPGDSGDPMGYSLTPEAQQRLAGYSVNQTSQDPNNTFYDVTGSSGEKVGGVSTPIDKDSWLDKIGYSGLPVLGLAGLGMFGPGGLLTGGAEAAGAAGGVDSLSAYADTLAKGVTPWETSLGSFGGTTAAAANLPELLGPGMGSLFDAAALTMPAWDYGSLADSLPDALNGLSGSALPVPGVPNAPSPKAPPTTPPTAPPTTPPPVDAAAPSAMPDWLKDYGKYLAPLLGGAVGLLGGDQKSSGGYTDSGYRPTITRGGWSPSAGKAPTVTPNIGLLNIPTTGVENAGLWRFLGGK